MAAPALTSRAGSVNSLGNSPTATPSSTNNNNKIIPSYPELDFRSGARIEDLNRLILEFSKHDQREYDDQRALEIHTAKDFIFSMLVRRRFDGEKNFKESVASWLIFHGHDGQSDDDHNNFRKRVQNAYKLTHHTTIQEGHYATECLLCSAVLDEDLPEHTTLIRH